MAMNEVTSMLDKLQVKGKSSGLGGLGGGLLGGVAGGAITSLLMHKKGRKTLGSVAKVGGIAALGGLAWKAYDHYQQNSQQQTALAANDAALTVPTPAPKLEREGFEIDSTSTQGQIRSWLLIQAMIAAANADGHIDAAERQRIFDHVNELGISREERAMLLDALENPAGVKEIAMQVRDQETAVEVYLASTLALDSNCGEGRRYLNALAFVLELPSELTNHLEQQVAHA